ncbi:SNF2-related protein [Acidithiobacillus sp.]|uniref:SNF2-related protein n=1 Tax=Acidithiobacillus sp. TaxID=1872118 RepID=UPI002624C61E|nr:SNF2-related protein [Acidithiobacillus sp.]
MAGAVHQSQYYAWLLTRRAAGDTVDSLASTLVDAQVDLNPHQVDAALFACKNPLSRGVILADEVGLGKTIEAGLVGDNLLGLFASVWGIA